MENEEIKLHLGCGEKYILGFVPIDLDYQGVLGSLLGRWSYKTEGDKVDTFFHRTTYDFNSFKKVLEQIGFRDIKRYDWQSTIHKDYDDHSQAYIPQMEPWFSIEERNAVCEYMDEEGGLLSLKELNF